MCSCPSYLRYRQTPLRERVYRTYLTPERYAELYNSIHDKRKQNARSPSLKLAIFNTRTLNSNAFLACLLHSRKRVQNYIFFMKWRKNISIIVISDFQVAGGFNKRLLVDWLQLRIDDRLRHVPAL